MTFIISLSAYYPFTRRLQFFSEYNLRVGHTAVHTAVQQYIQYNLRVGHTAYIQ